MVDLSIEANGGDAVKAKRRRRTHFIPPRGHVGLPPMSVRLRDCLEKREIHNWQVRHAKITIHRLNYV